MIVRKSRSVALSTDNRCDSPSSRGSGEILVPLLLAPRDRGAVRLTPDGPVADGLRVRGTLPPEVAARPGGLRITGVGGGDDAPTELRGVRPGQAAVLGAVATLHALGFRV